jgi:dienelactone hydrolase
MPRGAPLALLLAAVISCAGGPSPKAGPPSAVDPLPGAPPCETRELSLDGGFITVRVDIPREPPGPKPAVLALLGERPRMLRAGLVTISYHVHWEDLRPLAEAMPKPPPTERMWGKWLLASPSPGTIGRGYFEVITSDATRTIPRVLDAVAEIPEIDMTRIGIAGTSTTGFTALEAVAVEPRITAAVVGAACGDYHRFLYGSNLAMNGEFLRLDPDYESWLHSIEPIRHPERLVHAAVLLLAGDEDPVIPRRCIETTVEVLRSAYADAGVPERFRFRVVPGLGHSFTPPLVDDMMAWWVEWLTGRT